MSNKLLIPTLKIQACGFSDTGLVRTNNEDAWAQIPEKNFFVLADGMGGHNAGEIAAQEAVCELCYWINNTVSYDNLTLEELSTNIYKAIVDVNTKIYLHSTSSLSLKGMGTTLCCMYFYEDNIVYAHVGDSRIYRLRNGQLQQLTEDHSLMNELIRVNRIDEDHLDHFLHKNVITKALGIEKRLTPSLSQIPILSDDIYIMCSDGLSDYVSEEQITSILLNHNDLENAGLALIERANTAGGFDNITVILTKVTENE